MEKQDIYFWGNIEVRIVKLYLALNKAKICEVCNERMHIVDMCTLQKNREGTINISIKWLED